jgi:GGDEF domain-containing protein
VKRRHLASNTGSRRATAVAQRLVALVRHSPDAIFATDRRGRITAWNRVRSDFTGGGPRKQSAGLHVVRGARKVRATLSIGIHAIEPPAERDPAELPAEAEIARKDAKERGRDRFAVSGRNTRGSERSAR